MTSSEDYRREHTTVRLTDPTHDRLKAHNREGETLSGTVGRALDALAREQELPAAVRDALAAEQQQARDDD